MKRHHDDCACTQCKPAVNQAVLLLISSRCACQASHLERLSFRFGDHRAEQLRSVARELWKADATLRWISNQMSKEEPNGTTA